MRRKKCCRIRDRNIIWHGGKINQILQKHNGMTLDIIKQVPDILENPIIVLKSQNANSRVAIFGEVKDANGLPVTAILELEPTDKGGQVLYMNVIARIEPTNIVNLGVANAKTAGYTGGDGKAYVTNRYTARDLRIDNSSIRHGLGGKNSRVLANARLGSVIGDIAKNAIPINALTNEGKGVVGTFAMAALTRDKSSHEYVAVITVEQKNNSISDIEIYDVAHSVSGRQNKSSRADTKSQGVYPSSTATISIRNLLEIVNGTYQSLLSNDVLAKFSAKRHPDGYYTSRAKFSLKSDTDLEKQVAKLTKQNERLREQLKVSEVVKTSPKGIQELAKSFAKEYLSSYDATDKLTALYDYIANGSGEAPAWSEVKTRAVEIARGVLDNAEILNDEMYQQYSDLRSYCRQQQFRVSDTIKHDIADFELFRRQYFGKLNITTTKGTPVDVLYQEMSEMWPEWFNQEEISAPSAQLLQIANVLDELQPVYENPFSYDMLCASEFLANEIIDAFYDMPQQGPTYADRMNAKVRDAKIEGQRLLEKEKSKRQTQVSRLKEHYTTKEAKAREGIKSRELRKRIAKHSRDLSGKLLKPTDTKHVPEGLRSAVASVIDAINMESLYTVAPQTGKQIKSGEGLPNKRTSAFNKLREAYKKESGGYSLSIDPDLESNIDEIVALENVRLDEMTLLQLTTVWQTIRSLEMAISNANKMLGKSRFTAVAEVADTLRDELSGRKTKQGYWNVLGKVDSFLSTEMLKPVDYFHRLGTAGDALWNEIRGAQDDYIRHINQASMDVAKIAADTNISEWSGKKAPVTEFVTEGGDTLKMTPAQIMELTLLSL